MATHKIDLSEEDFFPAARRLLQEGASSEDRIEGWRGDMLCLSSTVGVASKLAVRDDNGGMRFIPWRPYPKGVR